MMFLKRTINSANISVNLLCVPFFTFSGKYIKQAQMVRAKSQLEHLQSEIASVARRTGISSATKLALIAPSADQAEDVPDIEWWDAAILPSKRYYVLCVCVCTVLVEMAITV